MRVLRTEQVVARLGLSRTTLWRMWTKGDFPRPRQISPGGVGWTEHELEEWLEARPRVGGDGGDGGRSDDD